MNSTINLIAFGTFGIPNGFRQSLFLGDKDTFSKVKTFDLNTNAIQLFPESKIYSIRKEVVNGHKTIAYAVYSFAKEKNSTRGGTFIGSSIQFQHKIANENIIKNCLDEFHRDLIGNKNNIDDQVIQVHHSDAFVISKRPKDFEKLSFNEKDFGEIDFSTTTKDLLVYDLVKPDLLQKALPLLNIYDTIFFTKSTEVAQFVLEKQLISVIQSRKDLEDTILTFEANIEKERKRKINQAIEEIETEISRFEEDRRQYFDKSNSRIASSKKQVQENDLQIKKFVHQYDQDNQQIQSAANYLKKVNHQLDEYKAFLKISIQKLQQETKLPGDVLKDREKERSNLELVKSKLEIPEIIKLFDQRDHHPIANYSHQNRHHHVSDDRSSKAQKSRSKSGKYAIIALSLLLIFTLAIIYFLFFSEAIYNL